jgi:hypothetical protein
MFGLLMESWYFLSIISLYLFLKRLGSDLKSVGSLRSACTKEFDMRRFCYLCAMMRRHRSGKCFENACDKELKSVFGRNLYDTNITILIFEIRLTFYCPFFNTIFNLQQALNGGGWSTPRPTRFIFRKDLVPTVRRARWNPGPVWKSA